MKRIASFSVNHNILEKGLYISRIDGDVVTYDIRMKKPNNEENDYLENAVMHTIEHLFATYVRNSKYSENIIYVGPMGCRTGFYFLVRDKISHSEVIKLLQDTFTFIADFSGKIPGTNKEECGNYKEHNLIGAKKTAKYMTKILENWTEEKMIYAK